MDKRVTELLDDIDAAWNGTDGALSETQMLEVAGALAEKLSDELETLKKQIEGVSAQRDAAAIARDAAKEDLATSRTLAKNIGHQLDWMKELAVTCDKKRLETITKTRAVINDTSLTAFEAIQKLREINTDYIQPASLSDTAREVRDKLFSDTFVDRYNCVVYDYIAERAEKIFEDDGRKVAGKATMVDIIRRASNEIEEEMRAGKL